MQPFCQHLSFTLVWTHENLAKVKDAVSVYYLFIFLAAFDGKFPDNISTLDTLPFYSLWAHTVAQQGP